MKIYDNESFLAEHGDRIRNVQEWKLSKTSSGSREIHSSDGRTVPYCDSFRLIELDGNNGPEYAAGYFKRYNVAEGRNLDYGVVALATKKPSGDIIPCKPRDLFNGSEENQLIRTFEKMRPLWTRMAKDEIQERTEAAMQSVTWAE